ncbi:MAG TPA: 50S ribosome-binding protein YggL [Aquabacterium sp.]|uniref:YggL 50S ribosome-binding family protein n=1 Tax=Aquabacterium sp. TaxID=1872578 RepID=UPI002E356DBF|nr:50S ribosome-binding protein YggL [Aquabacterium sp.]HEX5355480.1 50S ribosome-binding protein YggL [Aquabacterium sp.]
MAKQRSRRLRKKLHVGEFQEFGLAFKVQRKPGTLDISFVDALLTDVVDPRGLEFGGWASGGFVSRLGRGSVTEEDRQALIDWLGQRADVETAMVSGLMDAWYTSFVSDDKFTKVVG